MKPLYVFLVLFSFSLMAWGQQSTEKEEIDYAIGSFKSSRVILGHSLELPSNGGLVFIIQHHFGKINDGWYEFFGLDQANIRIGFDYGINNWLAVGIGRTSVQKVYDGYVKARLLRQSTGGKNMPLSVTYLGAMGITSLKWVEPERENYFSSRISYVHQLFIGRKFTPNFTFQIAPTFVHRNLVETKEDENDVWSIGGGAMYKVTTWLTINAEYYYLLPGQTADDFNNSFSLGVDLVTGGHVFQIFVTNSRGLIEQQFIPQTTGSWGDGDIHIGFNIHRTFQIKKPKNPVKDW